jgi:hypothetical protein
LRAPKSIQPRGTRYRRKALAAVYGGVLLSTYRGSRRSQLPLGPFILLGALAAIALLHVGAHYGLHFLKDHFN